MVSVVDLDVKGHAGKQVPSTLVRQDEPATVLAACFPGYGYTCDMPLFYYAGLLLLGAGADVLRVEYAYNRQPEFRELSLEAQRERLLVDSMATLDVAIRQSEYDRIVLIGKSIGTRVLAYALTEDERFRHAQGVWLTPLLRDDDLRQRIRRCRSRSLLAIGSADPHYDQRLIDEIGRLDNFQVLTIAGADHSLDIMHDTRASIEAIGQVMAGIADFLGLDE